jgi:hypothetical protein
MNTVRAAALWVMPPATVDSANGMTIDFEEVAE